MSCSRHTSNSFSSSFGKASRRRFRFDRWQRGLLVQVTLLASVLAGACRREAASLPDQPSDSALSSSARTLEQPWFTEVTRDLGLEFVHSAHGAESYFFPAIMAPGVALLDFDQDGKLDIFVLNGTPLEHLGVGPYSLADPSRPPTAGNRLWRQEADGSFTDVTRAAGLDVPLYGMGIAVGDINNDGYPDLYLSCYGADRLFLNQRDGTFEDITAAAGIDNQHWGASAVFFDMDRDGWLDLFVTNYVDYDPGQPCLSGAGQDFCNPAVFPGTPDRLYRNVSGRFAEPGEPAATGANEPRQEWQQENGTTDDSNASRTPTQSPAGTVRFEDVSLSSGIARKPGPGLGVTCADLTGNGWPDIYVANDGQANFLWVNQQDGTFRDEAPLRGAAYDAVGRSQGSMGIALADVNRDGGLDLLVTNLDGENNALYLSHAEIGFREGSTAAGLGASYPYTGFGTALVDLNHNGLWDMIVVNGRVRRVAPSAGLPRPVATSASDDGKVPAHHFRWEDYAERNLLFQELPEGGFRHVEHSADPLLVEAEASRGLAVGDLDNDGDLDLVITNSGGSLRVLRNDAPKQGHWLNLRVTDSRYGGRDAYGAQVTLVRKERRWIQVVQPGSSYLSSHDPRLHFGLGDVDQIDRIEVVWPDAREESFPGGDVDQFREITFGAGELP